MVEVSGIVGGAKRKLLAMSPPRLSRAFGPASGRLAEFAAVQPSTAQFLSPYPPPELPLAGGRVPVAARRS